MVMQCTWFVLLGVETMAVHAVIFSGHVASRFLFYLLRVFHRSQVHQRLRFLMHGLF